MRLTEFKLPPRCTKPKEKISLGLTETAIKKIFSVLGLVHDHYIKARSSFPDGSSLLETKANQAKNRTGFRTFCSRKKNVVVVYPENVVNVVVKTGENVVNPSGNVVIQSKNVVGGGVKKQWAAVKAARSMLCEKPLSFVMAPRVGIEPTAKRLTVSCSTAELPRNRGFVRFDEQGQYTDEPEFWQEYQMWMLFG